MKRLLVTAAAVLAVPLAALACGGGSDPDAASAADTLTRAQKDSIVADMPLPGAGGVGAAMRARDNANARTEGHDSIG